MDEHHHNYPKGVIICWKKEVIAEGGILYWSGINKLREMVVLCNI